MTDIANALLDSVPTNRMLGIRYLRHMMTIFGSTPSRPQDAFNGSDRSRIFPHIDGLFSNKTHGWAINADDYTEQMAWLIAQTNNYPRRRRAERCGWNLHERDRQFHLQAKLRLHETIRLQQ